MLEGLEAVRRRPGMYIGSTDQRGLHHLVFEIVDNSIDEVLAGYANRIDMTIHKDATVTVSDNGRGIPVDIHPKTGRPAVETAMTVLHAGGKFGGGGYKVASGLHGVGASAVNALSAWLRVDVRRDGKVYRQEYKRGVPAMDVTVVGQAGETGTTTTFLADKTIFSTLDYSFDTILQRCRESSYLTKGLTFVCKDERADRECTFYFEGGIVSFVRHLNKNRVVIFPKPIYIEKRVNGTFIEAALQYNDGYAESVFSFANNVNTVDGGTHLTGFRSGVTRTLNGFAGKLGVIKEGDANLSGDDVREGLTAILSVKLEEPQFESQTKAKLGNAELRTQVESAMVEGSPPGWRPTRKTPRRSSTSHRTTGARPGGRTPRQGAGDPQGPDGGHVAARQTGRLLGARPGQERTLHRGGRLRRRECQTRPRPPFSGHPPPAWQDPQRGKGPRRQDAGLRGDPQSHHRAGHRRGRPFRRQQAALLSASSSWPTPTWTAPTSAPCCSPSFFRNMEPHHHPRPPLHRPAAALPRPGGQGGPLRLHRADKTTP